jgi:hypothetical protein
MVTWGKGRGGLGALTCYHRGQDVEESSSVELGI